MAHSHSELKTTPSDDQQDPVVSQVTSSHKYYNRKQHIKDADEKSIQELLQNMLDDVPGADQTFVLRMDWRRPEDYLFLIQRFEEIQKEEKVCQKSGKELPASKLYFLAKVHHTIIGRDFSIPLQYLEKAAALGHSGALLSYGSNYRRLVSMEAAVKYFEQAGAKGNYVAEYMLGNYYYKLYRNSYLPGTIYLEKAKKYLNSSANKGYEWSQYMIGSLFLNGVWVHEQAPYFIRQSAETFQSLSLCRFKSSLSLCPINYKKDKDRAIRHLMFMSEKMENFSCVYHATMGLAHLMKFDKKIKLPQELFSAFGKLASEHSDKFLTLCKGDPWETVFPLLPAPTAKRLMELDSSLKLPAEFVKGESKEQPKESEKSRAGSELNNQASQVPNGISSGSKTQASVAEASTSLWESLRGNGAKMSTKTLSIVGQWKVPR